MKGLVSCSRDSSIVTSAPTVADGLVEPPCVKFSRGSRELHAYRKGLSCEKPQFREKSTWHRLCLGALDVQNFHVVPNEMERNM